MRVENFESFYVGSNHRDDTALLFVFEFCGAKNAERTEDFISYFCKKSERDIVVAVLFYISQSAANRSATYR